MNFLIINGPNLNMLGIREPDVYGAQSYDALIRFIKDVCEKENICADFYQSNHEGDIVDAIQAAYGKYDGIVINPAAYTHTSIAILDALKAVAIPTVEVHLSKIEERESFRQFSYISFAAIKTVTGLGFDGYAVAIRYLKDYIANK